jgi:hypothetical protein
VLWRVSRNCKPIFEFLKMSKRKNIKEENTDNNNVVDGGKGKGKPSDCESSEQDWTVLPIGMAMGFAFGFALQKGEVYLPMRIVNQFTLRDFTVSFN